MAAAEQWHWIHSDYGRLNSRGVGAEWITAPIFLFTKSNRLEFLINTICFLFLPGRVFAILTRLGARPRAAYYWMWILPIGYGFVLQAGSIANDMFSALWPMAAIEFALRARQTKRLQYLWLSILAAALMTSSKAFNLLLLPAWGLAILPSLRLPLTRPLATIAVCVIAVFASLIPTALLNIHYCGDWTGLRVDPGQFDTGPPLFHVGINLALLAIYNYAPPIFPFTGAWNHLIEKTVPPSVSIPLHKYFEPDGARLSPSEMQTEETTGLGFGVSVLLLTIAVRSLRCTPRVSFKSLFQLQNLIALAAIGGAFIFMAKSGFYAPARYLIPFYLFVLAPLLATASASTLTRQRWWRVLALATFFMAALLLILSPARPLWPATKILRALHADQSPKPLLQRAWAVYNVYTSRRDNFRPVRAALPPNLKLLGLVSFNDPETSLWFPFGSRRIFHIRCADSPQSMRERGLEYVVVNSTVVTMHYKMSMDEWLAKNTAEIVARIPLQILARQQPIDWFVVRLH